MVPYTFIAKLFRDYAWPEYSKIFTRLSVLFF